MIICRCNEVTQKEIKTFLDKHPHATFDELKLATSASTNCGKCSPILLKTYEKYKKDQPENNQLRISL